MAARGRRDTNRTRLAVADPPAAVAGPEEAFERPAHGNQRITRDEILDVAVQMFSHRGYRATNLGDVANELDVTRQALYYYFERKEDILVALFNHVFDELERAVDAVDPKGKRPGELFNEMLCAHLQVVSKYPAHVRLVMHEQGSLPSETRHAMATRRWAHQTRFMAVYEKAVRVGDCVDVGSDFAVSVLLSAANASYQWLGRVGVTDGNAFARETQQFLAEGYLVRSRRPTRAKRR